MMSGVSQIYMKRYTNGQGDKEAGITLFGINLLHKE
jgi:hypothetical protein